MHRRKNSQIHVVSQLAAVFESPPLSFAAGPPDWIRQGAETTRHRM